jgi:GTP cyclohydrolase II
MTQRTGASGLRSPAWSILDVIRDRIRNSGSSLPETRPFVTLTYAQSLDGSIASAAGGPLPLSSSASLALTHAVRAAHDAILVGIGCVLSDNPRLTVRFVAGSNPQPVVVDSRLRFPLSANLLQNGGSAPWIGTCSRASVKREAQLEEAGAQVIRVNGRSGREVDLAALLDELKQRGVRSIMVEGGARIITSFLIERLVDQMVITIAPTLVAGLRAVDRFAQNHPGRFPRLRNVFYERVGDDLVLRGDPDWDL